MNLRRLRIIAIAVALALVGAVLPLGAMSYVSWRSAVGGAEEMLNDIAADLLLRAEATIESVGTALVDLNNYGGETCTDGHIGLMRHVTARTPAIYELYYVEGDAIRCTPWSRTFEGLALGNPKFVTAGGLEIFQYPRPDSGTGAEDRAPLVLVRDGSYIAVVDPNRFVDVLGSHATTLVLGTEGGEILSVSGDLGKVPLQVLTLPPAAGVSEGYIYATAHKARLTALAARPLASIQTAIRREQLQLLPWGAFIALFVIGLTVWVLRRQLSPETEMLTAIRNGELIVHYQPLVDLQSGRCIGAEALVRWRRRDGRVIPPDMFIPFAEAHGVISAITDSVIDTVVRELKRFLRTDPELHIAINLGARDIEGARVLNVVEKALTKSGIRNEQIWLEVTERAFLDTEIAKAGLEEARARRHTIAIDDFGTGYSSLAHLQNLPLDVLKIDKAFVDTIGYDAVTSVVTPHIIALAKTLNLRIVAEGITTEEQASYLREAGVEYGQGYLFGKPMPAREFIAFAVRSRAGRGRRGVPANAA